MTEEGTRNWIFTGPLENFRINLERGFDVIGFKERRRRQAEEFEPGAAEELVTELDHIRKWPPDHWHLAFQGHLRTIDEHDARLFRERLTSTAATNTAAEHTAAAGA